MGLLRRLIKKAQTDFGVYSLAEEIALNSPQNIQRGDDYKRMFLNNGVKPAELEELGLNELFKQDRVNQREILDTISENRIEFEVAEYKGSAPSNFNFRERSLTLEEAYGEDYLLEEVERYTRDERDYLFTEPYQVGGDLEEFAKRIAFSDTAAKKLYQKLTEWWEGYFDFDELPKYAQKALEKEAEKIVREVYQFDPVNEIRLIIDGEETDYALINQEGVSDDWTPRGDAPPFLSRHFQGDGMRGYGPRVDAPTEASEAEVQLQSLAMEMGEIDLEPSDGLRWLSHTLPGGTNPQELVFKLKLPEIRFSEEVHYPDEYNQVFHVRTKDRMTPEGEKILYIEEFQSDWGQVGRREGFKDPALFKKAGADARRLMKELADIDVPLETFTNFEVPVVSVRQAVNLVGSGKLDLDTIYRGEIPDEVEYRTDQLRAFQRLVFANKDIREDIDKTARELRYRASIDYLHPDVTDSIIIKRIREIQEQYGERNGLPPEEIQKNIQNQLAAFPKGPDGNIDITQSLGGRSIVESELRDDYDLQAELDDELVEFYGLPNPEGRRSTVLLTRYFQSQAQDLVNQRIKEAGLPEDFLERIDSAVKRFEMDPDNKKALEMIAPYSTFQERAPFVTSSEGWNQLGIKYIFNKAADEGYDGVAFTPGEVHEARWGREGLIDAYNKTIPFAISKVINPATPTSNKNKTIVVEDEPNDAIYQSRIYRFEDPTKDGKTIADKSQRATMFSAPIGAGVIGLQALSPEEAAAQEVTAAEAETMMRVPEETGITNIFSDIGKTLYGAGEVAYEGVSDLLLEPMMGMAGAEAAFERGASPEEIEEARKRTIGLIDFETQSPRGRELKESALQGLGSLGEYLMEPTREYDPYYLKAMFQEGLVPATEAMTEAGLGIIGLDPRDTPEQERIRKEAARPVVEAVQPL